MEQPISIPCAPARPQLTLRESHENWFRLPHLFRPADARLATADATLLEERAKVGQAIAAFAALAERLEALAQRRPWWRRLVRP
jgi:hypothetical protein